MKKYIGLDISMQRTFICVLNGEGKIIHQGSEKTDPHLIVDYFLKQDFRLKDLVVGFESGSLSHYLINGFKERTIDAICMDARKLSPILSIKINKTDKNDARGIAEALRCNMYTKVICKPNESVSRSMLLASRKSLVNQRTAFKNLVRGMLKTYGIRLGSIGDKKFSSTVMLCLEQHDESAILSIKPILLVFDQIVYQVEELNKKIYEIASKDTQVKQLMTIPGVGPITSLTYQAEIFDPNRFHNSKAVGAYLGMTPTQYASGEIQRQGKISKCGATELRTLLVEAGIVILTQTKKWSKLKAWGLKIMRKKGLKKAAMGVGRKLAVIMHKMMLEKKDFIYGEPKEV